MSNSRVVQTVAATVVLVAAIVAVTLVTVTGASETAIVGFLSTVVIPSVVSLVALSRGEKTAGKVEETAVRVEDTAGQVADVADTMATVKQQTNGALSRIIDRLDALERATLADHGDIPQQGQETGPTGRGSTAGGS